MVSWYSSGAQGLVDAKVPEALVKVAGFPKEHQCDGGFEVLQRVLDASPPAGRPCKTDDAGLAEREPSWHFNSNRIR